MRFEIVDGLKVAEVADTLIRVAAKARDPQTVMAIAVIGGERHTCCDEAVVAYDGDSPIGIATIAPRGESGADIAEVVGLFVLEKYRRQSVGRELLVRAITRCRERRLVPLRLNILSKAASALVKKLPSEILEGVEVDDKSHLLPF